MSEGFRQRYFGRREELPYTTERIVIGAPSMWLRC